jgi:hypothetical protein
MKNKKNTKSLNAERSRYISDRFSQIIQAIDYWADLGIKYLICLNAGGIIVVLGFMGSSSSVRGMVGAKLALMSFVFGLVTVGIVLVIGFYRMAYCQKGLKEDSDKYISNKIDWEEVLENDAKRLYPNKWACLFAWGAFIFFDLGVILGLISLFTYK